MVADNSPPRDHARTISIRTECVWCLHKKVLSRIYLSCDLHVNQYEHVFANKREVNEHTLAACRSTSVDRPSLGAIRQLPLT